LSNPPEQHLAGEVAIVTGAGRGIGRATAHELASAGADVVVNDPGGGIDGAGADSRVAEGVVQEILTSGGSAVSNLDSVATLAGAQAIVDTALRQFGRIDVIVNNAGSSRQNMLWDMPEEDFESLLSTHLKGTWNMMRAAAPHLIAQRSGSIINMSSGVSVLGAIANAGYCAAKAGVLGLSAAAAMDLGPFGIRVNSLFPAASSRLDTKQEPWRKIYRTADRPVMAPDIWRPEIVATFVAYLASDRAADINGQLFACGGESIAAFPVWQADTTLTTPGGAWTLDSLVTAVPKLLANKVNPSPRQEEPFVWPWIRPGGLSQAHQSLERS
jgi:NAD(P)-dependent dehydrogenase (short-subunit alcohol dehydrogenase family)